MDKTELAAHCTAGADLKCQRHFRTTQAINHNKQIHIRMVALNCEQD